MNFFTIVGILAFAGYASAQCGCLKGAEYTVSEVTRCCPQTTTVCSKHLEVVGKTAQSSNVVPATVISSSSSNSYAGQALPIRVQAPAAVQTTAAAQEGLRYRVVQSAPQTVRVAQQQSSGTRYNAKVEVPAAVPSSVHSTTINLKPVVDRIVVPSTPRVIERRRETVYVNRQAPVYVSAVRESTPVYVNTVRQSAPVCSSSVRQSAPASYTSVVRQAVPASYSNVVRQAAPASYTSAVRQAAPAAYTSVVRESAPASYTSVVRESAPASYTSVVRESAPTSYTSVVRESAPASYSVIRESAPVAYTSVVRASEPASYSVIRESAPASYTSVVRESAPAVISSVRQAPVYTSIVREAVPVYSSAVRESVSSSQLTPARAIEAVNLIRSATPVYSTPIRSSSQIVRQSSAASSSSSQGSSIYGCTSRYGHSNNPFFRPVTQVDNNVTDNDHAKHRSKREVPFLRHGYKFMINMLPPFIQEPIKNTVNNLALTHPDQRLQILYNIPPKLTLLERLQLKRKKDMALLKSKLKNRIAKSSLSGRPYTDDKEYGTLQSPHHQEMFHISKLDSRFNRFSDDDDEDSSEYDSTKKQQVTQLKKAMLLRKLEKLDEDQKRRKRSTRFRKHWSQRHKKPSRRSRNMIDTNEIVLPFYQIKERSRHDKPWGKYYENSPRLSSRHRSRREDEPDNFLEPYTFKDVAKENFDTKEHFLRSVIREELGKYKIQNEEQLLTDPEPLLGNKVPHSPILHVVTFPLRLISQFSDITKQAFPMLGSLPQVIRGTKKYFKDFGKNFKKNMLHLTSDLIGDFEHMDIVNNVFGPIRQKRSPKEEDTEEILELEQSVENENPNYFLVFDGPNPDPLESRIRTKRHIYKKVDEDEIEEYLMDKLSVIFDDLEGPVTLESYTHDNHYPHHHATLNIFGDEESEKKLILEHLKPKIILDNNGKPFLEINGYKRPLFRPSLLRKRPTVLKKANKGLMKKLKGHNLLSRPRYFDSSEETDSDKIDSLIHHAKNHVEYNLGSKYSEMPIKTVKEKISQLLFETDILVHMDFERYDDIYDDLLALQHMKNSIVQDWKRLIMSKDIDDIGAKTLLLERFKELQYYKDVTLTNVVAALYEDNDNIFIVKKLIKMLVRLQKLQCLINQVVSNFQGHLHISNKSDIDKEIKYADILNGLNFAKEKSRNDMISNLMKERDGALQKNIFILDKLKKLLKYEMTGSKVEKEAQLLWEMKNIDKMQKTTIEDMKHRLDSGYKIKNELKILFDLLRRYEACEEDQKKLLSKYRESNEDEEEEVRSKRKKTDVKKKIDLEELRAKWQEKIKERNLQLRKQLRKTMKKFGKKSKESDDD